MRKRQFLIRAFYGIIAVFAGLLSALGGILAFAPDNIALQSRVGGALVVWCLPTLCAAFGLSKTNVKPHARTPADKQIIALIGSSLFLLMSLLGLNLYRAQFRGALFTPPQDFARTPGTITTSERLYQPGGKSGPSWRYHIVYDYAVSGRHYSSALVNFNWVQANRDRQVEAEFVQLYPVGREVSVFYLPNEPGFAVLDPNDKGTTPYLFGILLVIAVCCLATGVAAARSLIAGRAA